jgi:hypothetical protein
MPTLPDPVTNMHPRIGVDVRLPIRRRQPGQSGEARGGGPTRQSGNIHPNPAFPGYTRILPMTSESSMLAITFT